MRRLVPLIASIGLLALLLVLFVVPAFLNEPVRRAMERNANSRLEGYRIEIGTLRLQPLRLAVELRDTRIVQEAQPDPPMARIPRFLATVHWRALLHGRLVADVLFDRPALHLTLPQATAEAQDETPIDERGWQEALLAIYPLEVNLLVVRGAEVVYRDRGPFEPLRLTAVDFRANNIRNVWSPDRVYPSDMRLTAVVFESGRARLDGRANFLGVPHPGVQGRLELERIRLDYFQPLLQRVQLGAREGVLSAEGEFEYAPSLQAAHLRQVTIEEANLQFVRSATPAGQAREQRVREAVADEAQAAADDPAVRYRVDELRVRDSRLAFLNEATDPAYLLFLEETDLRLSGLNSEGAGGPATLRVTGRFMGSGSSSLTAEFRPEAESLDLRVDLRIEEADLPEMNNLLRAHGDLDVHEGTFSLYSELEVREGRIDGYLKPLLGDAGVYDAERDRHKPFGERLYERAVDAIAGLLENRPRDEVATVFDLSGPVEDPEASTWEIILGLIRNAFFDAILPGFES